MPDAADEAQKTEAAPPAETKTAETKTAIFTPQEGTDDQTGETPPPEDRGADTQGKDIPEWIAERFRKHENPVVEQARAYAEADKRLKEKTSEIEGRVRDEVRAEVEAEILGVVPENNAYTYPEGVNAPDEAVDTRFKEWAAEHKLSQEGFEKLVQLYGEVTAIPDPEAEIARLGENGAERLARLNARLSRSVPKDLHPVLERMMTTAEAVSVMEQIVMGATQQTAPGGSAAPKPVSIEDLRKEHRGLREDPNWGKRNDKGRELNKRSSELADRIAKLVQRQQA